jgi:hypothetical protein
LPSSGLIQAFQSLAARTCRGGICFNHPTTLHDPTNPRIMALGSQLNAWLTANNQIALNNAFTANTTALVLGRIQVNPVVGANDTLSLWIDPDVNSLGAPTASFSSANWIGSAGITSVSIQSYGAGNGGIIDAFRISDDADAYTQVTGSTIPDPVFGVDPSSVATNYSFGPTYPGGSTRTVLFRNEGPNNSLTVQGVSLTDDAGGVFTVDNVFPAVGSTLAPGETMSIRLKATSAGGGSFTGSLFIDTDSNPQDKTLPVTATVFAPGEKVNPNPTFDAGLANWSAAAAVTPGIAPGSPAMARVRGTGDKGLPFDPSDSLGQGTSIPDGAADWELGCYFTPVRAADYALYAGTAADGSFQDRSFQLAVFTGDNNPAAVMTDPQALNALLQIAYLPAGNGTEPEGFYAFDGTAWTRLSGLPAIEGSIDANDDGRLEVGTDTVRSYRLNVRGIGFGSGAASYSVTLSGGELAAPATQTGITYSAGASITSATPGSYAFTSADGSSISNVNNGLCTPFWVDDVFYYAVAMPQPSLTILGNAVITGFNQANPATSITLRNDGTTQALNITGVTFADPALSLVSPALPLQIAPGATAALEIQLSSAGIAPDTALLSSVQIASDDPAQPLAAVPVTIRSTTSENLLANWNFETPGLAPGNGDSFAFWQEADLRVRSVPGLLPGSATGVYLDSTGLTTSLSQTLPERLSDFEITAGFAVRPTANRALSLFLFTGTGHLNLRYEGSVWSAFNGSAWQPLIDMTAAPLTASVDGNFDGDFLDAGESFTAYKLHLAASGWGTPTPSYQLRILDALGQEIAASAPAQTAFQNGAPTTLGLSIVQFDNINGNNPGFWVDDVKLSSTTVEPPDPRITAITVNKATGAVSITFTSTAGASYSVGASDDLGASDPFVTISTTSGAAGSTTVTFTDPAAITADRRFYRIETP